VPVAALSRDSAGLNTLPQLAAVSEGGSNTKNGQGSGDFIPGGLPRLRQSRVEKGAGGPTFLGNQGIRWIAAEIKEEGSHC